MIKGDKTIIRPLDLSDLEKMYEWYSNFNFTYWVNGNWPVNLMLRREEFEKTFYDEDNQRYAILSKDKEFIGTIGFNEVNIPAGSTKIYIGIGEADYWGYGYGSDALKYFICYLFFSWNFRRLTAETWDGNIRASKCYEKLGFKLEGRMREAYYINGEYKDVLLYGLLKEEFTSSLNNEIQKTLY